MTGRHRWDPNDRNSLRPADLLAWISTMDALPNAADDPYWRPLSYRKRAKKPKGSRETL